MLQLFDAAADWKVIKENPMDGVQRPTIGKKEKKAMKTIKKNYTTHKRLRRSWRRSTPSLPIGGCISPG